ncbi:FAD-dependent oxidoreductase [Pelobacter seleniigenes]|uniref:FAD-dependent oxidoreductase n=1 Tax=Pelobacter seleniigenes TaxID=407188 RepID=UPI0004A6B1B5|nr:FAD-dependent oxidoreductase [Pelobacter seleniigenes]
MERKFPHLCQPLILGKVTLRNRMFSAPMGGTDITADCCIGRGSTAFYELRAKGGAAAVTVSELMVHPQTDGSHAFHIDLATPGSLAGFAYTADAIRRHGAIPSVELSHSGQFAGTYLIDKGRKGSLVQYGPSDGVRADGIPVKALSHELIAAIVEAYGEAAALVKRAGFEMVMVHGGHGWLINQFLSPYFNKRNDEYGGSLENRVRFAGEVLDSVRARVGVGFPIEFRMSGSELFPGGYTIADGIEIAKLLETKIDLLHVSAGTYQRGFAQTHPSMFLPHGSNVHLAAAIKPHVRVPVATIGGLNDPAMMEEIIASGKADVVEMARALLADHELPRKVMLNQDERIVHCLRCFTCMAERAVTATRRCAVNPLIGRELDGIELHPSPRPRKVLVAGGGPGGLEAALTAARRGHRTILCEKTARVGGILNCESALPFKREMYELGATLGRLAELAGVEIRCNTTVTREYVEAEQVDALIVAIGSEPLLPPVVGLAAPQVMTVNEYHLRQDEVRDQVVVIGGGLSGCELALHLARQGKQVTLVEMRAELAVDSNIRHRPILLAELEPLVTIHLNMRAVEVTAEGVLCADAQGQPQLIAAASVICAVGQRSRREEAAALLDAAPEVRLIGDCVQPANITTAIYHGYHAGLDL